jgi:predicted RNA-binding Zn-ribbon protein involved in translation (DUF1610 family)
MTEAEAETTKETPVIDGETTVDPPKRKTRRYTTRKALEGTISKNAIGYCSECGAAVFDGDEKCRGCGAKFNDSGNDEIVECPFCGAVLDLEGFRGKFNCPKCGNECEVN